MGKWGIRRRGMPEGRGLWLVNTDSMSQTSVWIWLSAWSSAEFCRAVDLLRPPLDDAISVTMFHQSYSDRTTTEHMQTHTHTHQYLAWNIISSQPVSYKRFSYHRETHETICQLKSTSFFWATRFSIYFFLIFFVSRPCARTAVTISEPWHPPVSDLQP